MGPFTDLDGYFNFGDMDDFERTVVTAIQICHVPPEHWKACKFICTKTNMREDGRACMKDCQRCLCERTGDEKFYNRCYCKLMRFLTIFLANIPPPLKMFW